MLLTLKESVSVLNGGIAKDSHPTSHLATIPAGKHEVVLVENPYKSKGFVENWIVRKGTLIGAGQSFWELLKLAGEADIEIPAS